MFCERNESTKAYGLVKYRHLSEIEEQLSAARRTYNASVTAYNNTVEMFPSSIIAGMMNFDRKDILEVTENKRETPQVNELFNA